MTNMLIKPKEFLVACHCNLTLTGQTEDKEPEWVGNEVMWKCYKNIEKSEDFISDSYLKAC